MQAEQSDIALANTLDTLRETGKAAGGATALAQAALKSKQNISSTIEKQEVQNEKLKAQGQLQVDLYRGQGELNRMKMQETRDVSELDRLQGRADLAKAQQIAARRGTISALGKGLSTLSSGVLPDQIPVEENTEEGGDKQEYKVINDPYARTDTNGMGNPFQIGVTPNGEPVYEDRG